MRRSPMKRSGTVGSIGPIEAEPCCVPKPTPCFLEEISLSIRVRKIGPACTHNAQEALHLRWGKRRSSKSRRRGQPGTMLSGTDTTPTSYLDGSILNAFFAFPQNSAVPCGRPGWTAAKRETAFSAALASLLRDCCAIDLLPSHYSGCISERLKTRPFS